jgi:hypothetical protein
MSMDELMGIDDYLGADDEVGIAAPRSRMRALRGVPAKAIANRLVSKYPGAPSRGIRRFPLPYSLATFTATSGTALTVTANTQKPYQANRLVVAIARSATTLLQLVTLTLISMGVAPQQAALNPIPAEAFAATVFDADVDFDSIEPGVASTITVQLTGAALAGAETINVSCCLFGASIG